MNRRNIPLKTRTSLITAANKNRHLPPAYVTTGIATIGFPRHSSTVNDEDTDEHNLLYPQIRVNTATKFQDDERFSELERNGLSVIRHNVDFHGVVVLFL